MKKLFWLPILFASFLGSGCMNTNITREISRESTCEIVDGHKTCTERVSEHVVNITPAPLPRSSHYPYYYGQYYNRRSGHYRHHARHRHTQRYTRLNRNSYGHRVATRNSHSRGYRGSSRRGGQRLNRSSRTR